jgi:hypothetical protein
MNIKETVYKIRKMSQTHSENEVKQRYKEFMELYPVLFKKAVDSSFDLHFLDEMLDTLDKVQQNQMTLDAADSNVYQSLQKVYFKDF